eukprot:4818849-Pyramimonas_sp.AAC.1
MFLVSEAENKYVKTQCFQHPDFQHAVFYSVFVYPDAESIVKHSVFAASDTKNSENTIRFTVLIIAKALRPVPPTLFPMS